MNGIFPQQVVRLVGRGIVPEDEHGKPLCMQPTRGSTLLGVAPSMCRKPAVALYHHKKSSQVLACCPIHDYSRHAAIWALIEPAYRREVVDQDLDERLARDHSK
jgi:hypothetical protein